MPDILRDAYDEVIKDVIEELKKEGKSAQEIVDLLEEREVKVIDSVTDKACEYSIEYMTEHMYENYLEWESRDAEFYAKQEQKWGRCFAASRMMYTSVIEMAKSYIKYITIENPPDNFKSKQYTFYCLVHLHGRACQEFLEILTLMKGGFADGAYARCRSLFELCCVASFIKEQGESIAEAYYKQSDADYQQKSYNWANSVRDFDGKNVRSFAQIQRMCNLPQPWKEGYDLTCLLTHASPQATFKRMANGKDINIIPVGRSDYNIKYPAIHSAICLRWITATFFTLFQHMDSLSNVKAINKWADTVCEMYCSTHDMVFAEAIKAGKAE